MEHQAAITLSANEASCLSIVRAMGESGYALGERDTPVVMRAAAQRLAMHNLVEIVRTERGEVARITPAGKRYGGAS